MAVAHGEVETDGGFVRLRDAAEGPVNVFTGERVEERLIETAAEPLPAFVRRQIDARLDRCIVRRAILERARGGPADRCAVFRGDEALLAAAIRKSVSGPVAIDSVQIEDISFSGQYEAAVEARMQAIVKQQQAEADKQKRIIDADASAYEVKAAADAKAHQIEVQGNAEAGAIKARGDALRNNPSLPTLVAAEKWNGVLPTTMVPGNSVPFVNVK